VIAIAFVAAANAAHVTTGRFKTYSSVK